MWRTNSKIGFDDRLVTAILVPAASFIIPIIFFGMSFSQAPYFTWNVYFSVLIITTVIWLGNRYILIWARRRYPQFEQVRKRLLVQSVVMFVYTMVTNNVLGYVLDMCGMKNFHARFPHRSIFDVITISNAAALFCSLTVVAIYESIYFLNELRKSVQEKEMLKRESLHAQLDALKTQVNPHFLFNNLNTLSSIIPEDPKKAVDFVQQLSKYAFLLQTRFGDNLDITIDVPEEKLQKKIVPLSLQILMENAIKHNIVSSDKPLKIDLFAKNGKLVVSNNLQKKNQVNESTGIGLENIRNRYRLLGNDQVEVTENGGNFTVSIPLIEN
jgi:hypothetical protein